MRTPQRNLRTGLTYWQSRPLPHIPVTPLLSDRTTEVVVIGAGITGAMAAEELTAAGLRVTIVDRRGPLQGATSATTALLQYEIDLPLTVLQQTHRPRGCRTRLAAVQAGLGKPGGESAIPGHPVRLQTRLLALPGGADAGCGRAGARMPGQKRHRPAHGVPDA